MKNSRTPEEKLFYFSGLMSVLQTVFNIQFSPQLAFMHMVIATAYTAILARVNATKAGDRVIQLPPEFFDKLAEAGEELLEKVKKNEDSSRHVDVLCPSKHFVGLCR